MVDEKYLKVVEKLELKAGLKLPQRLRCQPSLYSEASYCSAKDWGTETVRPAGMFNKDKITLHTTKPYRRVCVCVRAHIENV